MPALIEQQRRFRAFLLGAETNLAAEILERDEIAGARARGRRVGTAARLAIYRNNVIGNLTGALKLTFPAIERLVGGPFFAAAAQGFIPAAPPQSADLYEFGETFPSFLSRYEPAASLPYLAAVARLEWCVCRALHAPDAPFLEARDLAACADPDTGFVPHPSLSLLRLDYPAAAIWSSVLTPDPEERERKLAAIALRPVTETLAVARGPQGLDVRPLSPSAFALARALASGTGLSASLSGIPAAAAPLLLAEFVTRGFFTRLSSTEGSRP